MNATRDPYGFFCLAAQRGETPLDMPLPYNIFTATSSPQRYHYVTPVRFRRQLHPSSPRGYTRGSVTPSVSDASYTLPRPGGIREALSPCPFQTPATPPSAASRCSRGVAMTSWSSKRPPPPPPPPLPPRTPSVSPPSSPPSPPPPTCTSSP